MGSAAQEHTEPVRDSLGTNATIRGTMGDRFWVALTGMVATPGRV
jgi:hypothetical protein